MRLSTHFTSWALLCAVGVAGMLPTDICAQDKILSDHRLPPGVLVYTSSPDIPASYEAFKNTSYGQLINSPELEEFRLQLLEKFETESQEHITKVEDELGMPLSDLAAIVAGDASFAILRPIGQPLAAVAFLEIGDHRDIVDNLLALVEKQVTENSHQIKETEEISGTEVNFYTIETPHPDYSTIDISYFIKDGQLVIATSRSVLELVLERWDGKHAATFADDELYATIREKCATNDGSTPDMIWYINPIGLTTAALELVPQAKPFVGLLPLYLPTLGLNRLKASGSTLEVDSEEFNIISRTLIYVERPASGILKMFEMRATIDQPASWVPASATQYFAADWNVSGAYEAVESVYDGFIGPGAFDRQISDLTRQANQNNLHMKRDIVDVLSGKFEGYVVQGMAGDRPDVKFAASIGVTDEKKAWTLVETAMESANEVQEHDIQGAKAYTIVTTDDVEVAVTVTNNQVYVASSLDRLKEVVAGKAGGDSLVNSPDFKRAQANIPEQVSMLSYQSPAAQLRDPYEKLRKGEFDAATDGKFDFSVLPPFEKIEKYFAPSFGYLLPDDKGAFSVQFGLKPAK